MMMGDQCSSKFTNDFNTNPFNREASYSQELISKLFPDEQSSQDLDKEGGARFNSDNQGKRSVKMLGDSFLNGGNDQSNLMILDDYVEMNTIQPKNQEYDKIFQSKSQNLIMANSNSQISSQNSSSQEQQNKNMLTSQDISRILDTTFNQTTTINLPPSQQNVKATGPKSPIFKNQQQKGGLKGGFFNKMQNFMFDLKAVNECNNVLEESLNDIQSSNSRDVVNFKSQKQQDELDSLFINARKKLNLETALMEEQSVVSDSVDIKSVQSDSEQVTLVQRTPFSDQNQKCRDFTNKTSIDDILNSAFSQFQEKMKLQFQEIIKKDQIFVIFPTAQFYFQGDLIDELKIDLVTKLNESVRNGSIDRKNPWRLNLQDDQNFLRSERNSNNIQTANPSYDMKSENSSNYIKSVAAFSAQPNTLVCSNCKRRISNNNFVIPSKGKLNINPFQHYGFKTSQKSTSLEIMNQNFKRVMSGPNFNPDIIMNNLINQVTQNQIDIIAQKHKSTSINQINFEGLIDEMRYVNQDIENENIMIPRKRSISFNKDQKSRNQSLTEDEVQMDLKDSCSKQSIATLLLT
ncbi:UNKNOWN [Stylonychia lemnae]|uniref:Uncharacterized protein n=1 Tax=Stylonychia lemnae TaxID=5949 RepID=A0A078AZ31_STYLE|nr:UNKNOWN [Stylonychia lemnae]|eukprot:CDW87389.1 UNKNOWN [Stylonychia lemnae]